ncbi:hypothetical protein [Prosthecobacter dejongeii]|uniref:Uncharacterized protein n=1 Tax=Prosthecobacter dejongeii TaxID=48465 RepID=A0A7W7YKL4_9BACT|nr:hypothetical protein [Prosthecobacter dejongeii]MBB5037777.1 hypothetical protein [Prosthecobacter dejongeii]
MEPLTPNDPLWKVLGQAKPVEPRPNFTQNVVRLARQTPQERGWLAQMQAWWQEKEGASIGLTWAAVAAVVLLTTTLVYQPTASSPQVAQTAAPTAEATAVENDFPLVPEFETEWKNLEQVGDLLAVHDTSLLTDSEINVLLY